MQKLINRGAIAGVLAVSLMGLAACGGGSDAPKDNSTIKGEGYDGPAVELAFWNGFTGADGAYFDDMVSEFNTANPNIKVTSTTMEWGDLYPKLPIAVMSNSGPDVAVIHLDQVANQAAQGAITPLDGVAETLKLTESDFAKVVWEGGIYKDARYSIPLDIHMHALYYNKGVLEAAGLDPEKPPTTGDELIANLEVLKSKDVQGMWIDSSGWMRTWFTALQAQFGGSLFSEDGTQVTWNDEAGVKALTWMSDLINEGYSPANVGQDGYWKAFATNENAYVIGGIWELGNPTFDDIDWGVAPLPVIGDKPATWGSSHQFVMTTQVEEDENKKNAAAFFINELSKDSIKWAKANQVPARLSVQESAEFMEIPHMDVFSGIVDEAVMPQTYPGLADSFGPLEESLNAVLLGNATPKEGLDKSAAAGQLVVDDNRSKYGY